MEFFEFASIAETFFSQDILKNYRWAYFVIAGCCFALLYVFEAIALYTIAKREGFKNKWMAFVPVLNTYYIGVVSEKNNILRFKAKHVAIAAAITEAVYIALNILYFVAMDMIFSGGYADPVYGIRYIGPYEVEVLTGYQSLNLPFELEWAWWVFANIQNFVIYWVQLVYVVLNVFVMVAFFRTYASQRYVIFSILCILLPVKGIVMFAVRNNKSQNYMDYIKEVQQRRYYMYREYMRNNPPPQGGYGNVPPPPQGGSVYGNPPSSEQSNGGRPDDPFGGLGEEKHGDDSDPFDGFNN